MAFRPKRVAAPSAIAAAAARLLARIEASDRLSEAQRHLWFNVVTKAFVQLMDGVRIDREDNEFIFPSRSRGGLAHRVNGSCSCEACSEQRLPCWHRAARWMVLDIEAQERATLLTPQPEPTAPPIHCPGCAAPLLPDFTSAGEECFRCANPACNRVIHADVVEAILA